MNRDSIDLGKTKVSQLFRIYLIPTLIGMLSICVVTATDGIFIGRGIGSEGVAAINIAWVPIALWMGFGLMMGVGCSVISSIQLSRQLEKTARINVSQAFLFASVVVGIFIAVALAAPVRLARFLGASDNLLPLAVDYICWLTPSLIFNMWMTIGLFIIRLDGAPKLAMWCNIIPGVLNAVLDYIMIFPLGMGMKGAAIATATSTCVGGTIVMIYLLFFAKKLRLIRLKCSLTSIRLMCRNLGYQMRVGLSAFLGEATLAILMFTGNQVFMKYLGDDGVGAFGIACYYCPFIFMVGNGIAQSAQPILSFNHGALQGKRVRDTERLAVTTAVIAGILVTSLFIFIPKQMVSLFLDPSGEAAQIAIKGLPYFSSAVVFYIFNLTAIGYFQSVERPVPAVVFALLRGLVFLVPSFILLPKAFGINGIWCALGLSESLTAICIIAFYIYSHK